MGSARTASARGRAAQLFAGFAHRGARLIDDADPEHDAVIDTVRGRQCAVLNFPSAELVLFARRVVFGSDYEDGRRVHSSCRYLRTRGWVAAALVKSMHLSARSCSTAAGSRPEGAPYPPAPGVTISTVSPGRKRPLPRTNGSTLLPKRNAPRPPG